VIECAWAARAPVRCLWLRTSLADAQINAIVRLIEAHGRLPAPEELRELGRRDHRYFGPDAQFRYERSLEPPVPEEGFGEIEERGFTRRAAPDRLGGAVIVDVDSVLCADARGAPGILDPDDVVIPPGRRETLARYVTAGWTLFGCAWRPQIARGETSADRVERSFTRIRELLGLEIDLGYCPHDAGPPVCWCRKPLPGLVLEHTTRHRLRVEECIVVARPDATADRTMAQRLGAALVASDDFFGVRE
jgi:histidinol phosphatase-like enzyme